MNLPNILTISRLAMIPIVSVLLYLLTLESYQPWDRVLSISAAWVFVGASVTDILDGYFARKFKQVSVAGKFFDPMADKLMHMAAMVFLIPLGRIEAYIVAVLLFREIFITGLRTIAVSEGVVISAGFYGKLKSVALSIALACLIHHYPYFKGTSFEINIHWLGKLFLWIGLVLAVISGFQYTWNFLKKVKGNEDAA